MEHVSPPHRSGMLTALLIRSPHPVLTSRMRPASPGTRLIIPRVRKAPGLKGRRKACWWASEDLGEGGNLAPAPGVVPSSGGRRYDMSTMKTLGLAIGIAFVASSLAFAQQSSPPANAAASGGAGTHQNSLRTGGGANTQKVQRNQQGYRQAARVRAHPLHHMRMQAPAARRAVIVRHHAARLRPHPLHHMKSGS